MLMYDEPGQTYVPVCVCDPAALLSYYGAEIPSAGKAYIATGYASEQINAGNHRWGIWRKKA
jgi:hypothetical protein